MYICICACMHKHILLYKDTCIHTVIHIHVTTSCILFIYLLYSLYTYNHILVNIHVYYILCAYIHETFIHHIVLHTLPSDFICRNLVCTPGHREVWILGGVEMKNIDLTLINLWSTFS